MGSFRSRHEIYSEGLDAMVEMEDEADVVEADVVDKNLKNFWISWWHSSGILGDFELNSPWWVSGSDPIHDDHLSICAAVKAVSEDHAIKIIEQSYDTPPVLDPRFCGRKPNDWTPFCDRFPRANWMKW
jgi:hypothetical protein